MVVGMEIAGVVERVGAIASVRANTAATADLIESGLVAVREVQAWCDAQHAGLVEAVGEGRFVPRAAHREGVEEVVEQRFEDDGAVRDVDEDPEVG